MSTQVWFIGDSHDMKSHVVKEVTSSIHTWDYTCPMLARICGAPRGIVVAGMDPWTPCNVSNSPSKVVDSPSYKKKGLHVPDDGCDMLLNHGKN